MNVRRSRGLTPAARASVALSVLALAACGGGDNASGVGASRLPEGVKSEAVEHEACNESGNRVEVLDANGDGKPDIKRVFDGSNHEVCRVTDLNHDGKPDLYEYYDASGNVRRREADYDSNGVIDSIELYEGGKLVRREYDTTGQNRIDTWDYFDPATGRRTRRERDTNNDGKVDQWWTWDGDRVTIATDKNGDGKPDPDTTIVLGGGADGGLGAPIAPDTGAPPPPPGEGGTAEPAPPPIAPPVVPGVALDAGPPVRDAGAAPKGKGRH